MGMFTSTQKSMADTVYKDMKKKYLKPKDGKKHVVMINSFSKLANQVFDCEDKYTTQIDEIVSRMQDDGYEILDIKFNSLMNQGLLGQAEGFHTLIIYQ